MPYGRVPAQTTALFKKTIDQVRRNVREGLPGGVPAKVEAYALERVLHYVLTDWSDNDNTDGLTADDLADLTSFVKLAYEVAEPDPHGRGFPIFQATLDGLLEDWLHNWNAGGQSGPPRR